MGEGEKFCRCVFLVFYNNYNKLSCSTCKGKGCHILVESLYIVYTIIGQISVSFWRGLKPLDFYIENLKTKKNFKFFQNSLI